MTKFIERKYIPFAISLAVVAVLGLIAGVVTLRARNAEPVKVSGRTAYVLQFSRDGNTLLGLSLINDHPLMCAWNPQDGHERWRWSFPAEERAPFSLAQSPDGKYVAAISVTTESLPGKSVLRLWEIGSGRLAQTYSWTEGAFKAEPDGQQKTRHAVSHKISSAPTPYVPLSLHFKRDGKLLVCYASDGEAARTVIATFDPVSGKLLGSANRFAGSWEILRVAETEDAVLASNGTKIAVRELSKPAPVWETTGKTAVADRALRTIYVGREGKLLKIDRSSGRTLWSLPFDASSPMELAGTRLVTATRAGMVEVRRISDGTVQQNFEAAKDYKGGKRTRNVDAIAVSAEGTLLAVGGHHYEQDQILIWPLR